MGLLPAVLLSGLGRDVVYVEDVGSPLLIKVVEWRRERNPKLTPSSLRKDLVTIRQVLKFAVGRGVVPQVPLFPGSHIIGSIEANPQPWLDRDEWKVLMAAAEERIEDAADVCTKRRRTELRDYLLFMHATGLRVDEARHLQVRDCTIEIAKSSTWQTIPAITLPRAKRPSRGVVTGDVIEYRKTGTEAEMRIRYPYVAIRLRRSKTGARWWQSRAYADRVFKRLAKGKAPTDLLFTEHHRDAFRELLIAAKLRTNDYGHPRNAKCLRRTAISHWLLDRPTIPLSWFAANCGTSITMLQQFYVKRLGLALDGSAWL